MFILDRILQKQGFILADGATGTNYFQLGLETGYPRIMVTGKTGTCVGVCTTGLLKQDRTSS